MRPLVMGVLNVTPDSFSDGGLYDTFERAVAHGLEMMAEGADVVDVGGESSRPGADPVDLSEELAILAVVGDGMAGSHGIAAKVFGTLADAAVKTAWDLAANSDAFIAIDSALRTIPLSLLPSVPLTRGVPLALIGRTPTQYDRYAQVVIRSAGAPIVEALAERMLGAAGTDPRAG